MFVFLCVSVIDVCVVWCVNVWCVNVWCKFLVVCGGNVGLLFVFCDVCLMCV